MITLHHFTNPRWLEAQGGWLHPATPQRFARFAARAVAALGDLCQLWCTINEPIVYATQGYLLGIWPPGRDATLSARSVSPPRCCAGTSPPPGHSQRQPGAPASALSTSCACSTQPPQPCGCRRCRHVGLLIQRIMLRALRTGRVLPPFGSGRVWPGLRDSCDFFGLNYYTRERVAFDPRAAGAAVRPALYPAGCAAERRRLRGQTYGEIYPAGLYRALRRAAACTCRSTSPRPACPTPTTTSGRALSSATWLRRTVRSRMASIARRVSLDAGR